MPATVHAGTVQRWYEELCRIRVEPIRTIVANRGTALRDSAIPTAGGVYCFWWTGDLRLLQPPGCNRFIELAGPGARPVQLHIDDEWLGIDAVLPIPLYVGKTADNLVRRVSQHLRLADTRTTAIFEGFRKQPRPTTSCQVRAGVEHLFPALEDTRDLVLDNLGLSYVVLNGDDHAANRFYLEDYAIGLARPPLNIDIER